MSPPLSRRRVLAAAAPGLLAGCLVESEESGTGSGAGTDGSETETSESAATDDVTDGGSSDSDSATSQQADDEDAPDEVGPDGSGLVVTDTDILDVTGNRYETTLQVRLTVENAGRFTYGTVEFRADAYTIQPNTSTRDAEGHAYVTRRFRSGDRFDDGTRRFDVAITFPVRLSWPGTSPDRYEVDAAVRRAEPSHTE